MASIEIVLGGSGVTNWPEVIVTALVPAAVGAGSALLGVWLSNRASESQRRADDADRVQVERRDRSLAALALADHLEGYALSCVEAVDSFVGAVWTSPYETADYGATPAYAGELPPWPTLVDWRLLGPERAVQAENFRRQVELRRLWVRGYTSYDDREDAFATWTDLAADLGLAAWSLAQDVRSENALAPFHWPEGMDGAKAMQDHLIKRKEVQALRDAPSDDGL